MGSATEILWLNRILLLPVSICSGYGAPTPFETAYGEARNGAHVY
jgi:hypothetical protein